MPERSLGVTTHSALSEMRELDFSIEKYPRVSESRLQVMLDRNSKNIYEIQRKLFDKNYSSLYTARLMSLTDSVMVNDELTEEFTTGIYTFLKSILKPIYPEFYKVFNPSDSLKWRLLDSVIEMGHNKLYIYDDLTVGLEDAVRVNADAIIGYYGKHPNLVRPSDPLRLVLKYGTRDQLNRSYHVFHKAYLVQPTKALVFINSGDPLLRGFGSDFMSDFMTRAGLSDTEVLREWKNANGENHSFSINRNYDALVDLEGRRPGSAKRLHELFNISNFGRYPQGALLEQLNDQRFKKDYGLLIYPKYDWNGAFFHVKDYIDRLMQNSSVKIFEAGSKLDVIHTLNFVRKKKKPDYVIFAAHGHKRGMRLGEEDYLDSDDLSSEVLTLVAEAFGDIPIFIQSCHGADLKRDGVAAKLQNHGFRVTAAKGTIRMVEKVRVFRNRDKKPVRLVPTFSDSSDNLKIVKFPRKK